MWILKVIWITLVMRFLLWILGIFILPIGVLFRKKTSNMNTTSNQECFKWFWLERIYGNIYDGFGDSYYYRTVKKDTWWSRYWWSAFRNPTHNYLLTKGVYLKRIVENKITGNPKVTDDPHPRHTGYLMQVATAQYGKEYKMFYYCIMWVQILSKIIPWYKPKYDDTPKRGIRLLIGYKNFAYDPNKEFQLYGLTFALNPIKLFVKG